MYDFCVAGDAEQRSPWKTMMLLRRADDDSNFIIQPYDIELNWAQKSFRLHTWVNSVCLHIINMTFVFLKGQNISCLLCFVCFVHVRATEGRWSLLPVADTPGSPCIDGSDQIRQSLISEEFKVSGDGKRCWKILLMACLSIFMYSMDWTPTSQNLNSHYLQNGASVPVLAEWKGRTIKGQNN